MDFEEIISKAVENIMYKLNITDEIYYDQLYKIIEQTVYKCMLADIKEENS